MGLKSIIKEKFKFSVGMKLFIPFFIVNFLIIALISYFAINKMSEKLVQLEQRRAVTILESTMDRLNEDTKEIETYVKLIADTPDLEKAIAENNKNRLFEILAPAKFGTGEQKVLVYDRNKKVVARLNASDNETILNNQKVLNQALSGITTSGLEVYENGLYLYIGTPVHFGLAQYYLDKMPVGAVVVYRRIGEVELKKIKERENVDINIFYEGKLADSTIEKSLQPKIVKSVLASMNNNRKSNFITINEKDDYINNWENIGPKGVISVMQPNDELMVVKKEFSNNIIATTLVSGLLVILSSYFLAKVILYPLRRMLKTTKAITAGDFNQKVEVYTKDEFEQLGSAINYMADKVRERLEYAEHLAAIDGLTNMYNHRYFQQRLEEELEYSKVNKSPLSLVMIDIDYFKHYNDNQGHPAGDKVLQQISQIIKDNMRTEDIVARYGGEEFAIILLDTDAEAALEIGEKIRLAVENFPFVGKNEQPNGKVTISLGISTYPVNATNKDDLIKMADDALYKAKFVSRNKTVLYYSVFDELKSELHQNEHDLLNTIKTLISVINSKDRYTYGHSERVAQYAVKLAQAMGLSEEEIKTVRVGAYLHDIGKIEIERDLLNKAEPLNELEWNILKQHPVWGVQIISAVKSLNKYVPAILNHHESYDGKGYPEGLKGKDIPLVARILKVADCFDAMTTQRPYKPKRTRAEACNELERCSGTEFDPEIVKVFIKIISENNNQDNKIS